MIRMGKESRLVPAEVVEEAVQFFGPGGMGLEIVDRADCCARFEGAGGYVFVQGEENEGSKGSSVTIEGREWDHQIKQFLQKV